MERNLSGNQGTFATGAGSRLLLASSTFISDELKLSERVAPTPRPAAACLGADHEPINSSDPTPCDSITSSIRSNIETVLVLILF